MKEQQFLDDVDVLHQFMRSFFKDCNGVGVYHDMNKTQINVLVAVAKYQDNTMSQISEEVGLEKGSFTTVVDSLIQKGYLQRVRSTKDRRKISLQMTCEGQEIAKMLVRHREEHIDRMFANCEACTLKAVKEAVHTLAEFAREFKE
ncbi:MAG: MarR family winged helix-turn-helix transcriptional regulator [Cellulosilyticaceae bacterium]